MCATVTVWVATSPVKLPTRHGPHRIGGLDSALEKRGIPLMPRAKHKTPSYSRQFQGHCQCQATVKLPGSFCPGKSRPHLHSHFNFAGSVFKTVACSLGLSYGSELTRQRTSLPSNSSLCYSHINAGAWSFLPSSLCHHRGRTISSQLHFYQKVGLGLAYSL